MRRIIHIPLLPLALVSLLSATAGCGIKQAPLVNNSPLLNKSDGPLIVRRPGPDAPQAKKSDGKEDGEKKTTPPPNEGIRAKMVAEAEKLLENGSDSPNYGSGDLAEILSRVLPSLGWTSGKDLQSLVDIAAREDGYHTLGGPKKGDIVLFHNMVDANGNGKLDDWLMGCAVVVDGGDTFTAIGRTGHGPRAIVASPDGPSRAEVDGEKMNTFVRIPHRSDPPETDYLAGQLYAGYIDIEALARAGS